MSPFRNIDHTRVFWLKVTEATSNYIVKENVLVSAMERPRGRAGVRSSWI